MWDFGWTVHGVIAGVILLALVIFILGLWLHDAYLRAQIVKTLPPAGEFIETSAARLHFLRYMPSPTSSPEIGGDKILPPIVLLHGSGGSAYDVMLALGNDLNAACRGRAQILAFDRPGIGRSRNKVSPVKMSSPKAQARTIREAIKALGLQNPVLIGHSWGGAVAIAYAQEFGNEITGSIALAPPLFPWSKGRRPWFQHFMTVPIFGWMFAHLILTKYGLTQMQMGIDWNFQPEKIKPNYIRKAAIGMILLPTPFITNSIYAVKLSDHLQEMCKMYRDIAAPIVLITGDSDQTVNSVFNSHRFLDKNPNSALIFIEGAGHMLHHTQSKLIADAAIRMLEGQKMRAGVQEIGRPRLHKAYA